MLNMLLVKRTDKFVCYRFFPEGKESYGELSLNLENGDIEIVREAANDEFNRYLHHAVTALDKYYESGIFLENDVVAWY